MKKLLLTIVAILAVCVGVLLVKTTVEFSAKAQILSISNTNY